MGNVPVKSLPLMILVQLILTAQASATSLKEMYDLASPAGG